MSYTPNIDEDFESSVRREQVPTKTPVRPQAVRTDTFDDILRIFDTPEYQARRAQAQADYIKQQQSYQTAHGTVSHVNTKKLKKKRKWKLTPFGKGAAVVISLLGCLVIIIAARMNAPEPEPIVIPDGYVQIYASEDVNYGESVYSIASEYYDPHIYGAVYDDLNEFVDIIIDTNKLPYDGKITPYDTLSIPVLVDVDNLCYQELKSLEAQIKKIKEEAYWIDYTVQYGDSLSSIAAKASGSYGETISLVNEIMSKNKLSNSLIYAGQQLKIVNPALGQLKISFNEMQNALFDSLKTDSAQK